LGLSPEFKAEDLPVRTRRPNVLVEVPEPVPVDAMTPELPWDLQNAAVVTPVARPAVSWPTPAIHLACGETMASIGQGVVGEAPCVALVEVGAEQLLGAQRDEPTTKRVQVREVQNVGQSNIGHHLAIVSAYNTHFHLCRRNIRNGSYYV
jgi:hypothetical protein